MGSAILRWLFLLFDSIIVVWKSSSHMPFNQQTAGGRASEPSDWGICWYKSQRFKQMIVSVTHCNDSETCKCILPYKSGFVYAQLRMPHITFLLSSIGATCPMTTDDKFVNSNFIRYTPCRWHKWMFTCLHMWSLDPHSLYYNGSTFIPVWISNDMLSNFNGCTIQAWKWIRIFVPHF